MQDHSPIKKILLIALVIETLCVTYARYLPSWMWLTSILYTFSGVVIAMGLLLMKPSSNNRGRKQTNSLVWYRWVVMGIVLLLMCYFANKWMEDEPLNYLEADMLPIIKVMCERFIAGAWQHVYDPIPEIWAGARPIYLPAMWLPYTLPVILHIDVRWITVVSLFVVCCVFLERIFLSKKQNWVLVFCAALVFGWLLIDENAEFIPYTEEGIVIVYYVLLTIALMKKNAWLIGIAASLCVLSRYALVGWLPAMCVFYIYRKEWKNLFRFTAAGAICFLILVVPFGLGIFRSLLQLPDAYIAFTERVWHDSPHVFLQNPGWARFFGAGNIRLQHQLLVYLSLTLPTLVMVIALRWQRITESMLNYIPLTVLQITLVVFYTLVDVPYLYLFYTSSFVSLVAITFVLNGSKK